MGELYYLALSFRKPLITGALFEGIEVSGVVAEGGRISLARGVLSVASDAVGQSVGSYFGLMIKDVKTREKVSEYLLRPLASGLLYLLLANYTLKVDNRKWLGPFLEQVIASEASGLIEESIWPTKPVGDIEFKF